MDYQIIRSNRKTISIQITPQGEIRIRCPRGMKKGEIQTFAEEHRDWIEKHLPKPEALALPGFTQEERALLARQASTDIPQRVARFAKRMGVTYGRITIRCQKTRWGSCSGSGNLNFNCLLMLTPESVRDYVVVHELCHRKEMNHGEAFWAEVAAVLPDYRENRKWLKDKGGDLIRRLS